MDKGRSDLFRSGLFDLGLVYSDLTRLDFMESDNSRSDLVEQGIGEVCLAKTTKRSQLRPKQVG